MANTAQPSHHDRKRDPSKDHALSSHLRQKIEDGYGPLFHRIYSLRIPVNLKVAREAMLELKRDLNSCSPQAVARFEKVSGEPERLARGDEFKISLTGPWDAPVRVAEVGEDGFRLLTLEGHIEAGEISFRVVELSSAETVFEIESLARSRDALIDFLYDKVPVMRSVQTGMWECFCRRFAELCLGESAEISDVEVRTERRDETTGLWDTV